ncbi:amino acid ABC transporter permease [Streptomyces sp. TRM68367]|uniref:amino acid ABC transporter permease n=1 Tax=Streptomyces sp. TRM68367 TaxID=2758415 RepID=UPI00165B44B4|nr:amino acid ABC transporter permease [Streptomyces sp. TRM68367]MBC9727744.1 amino acid ABC transporter permease [Streptomyces sp. TRM68367]
MYLAYTPDLSVIGPALPTLLDGLRLTLEISAIVIAASSVLAFPVAVARMSKIEVIWWPAQLYIEAFRCTPLLVQLLWVFYALPALLDMTFPAKLSIIMALTAHLTAFMAETYRAGMQSIPVEQIEAARMLRMGRVQILRHIIVPQAFRQQIPTILSLNVSMFKDTSLVSALGSPDLTFQGNILSSQTYRPMEIFTLVALLYFAIAFPATLFTSYIERRMITSGSRGAPPPSSGLRGTLGRLRPGYRPPVAANPSSVKFQPEGA